MTMAPIMLWSPIKNKSRLDMEKIWLQWHDWSRVIQRIIVALMMKIWSQDYSQSSGYTGQGLKLITLNRIATIRRQGK